MFVGDRGAREKFLRGRAAFTFVHLAGTDATGHMYGFDVTPGSAYLDAVRAHDRALGKLLATIDGDLTPRRLPPLRTAYPRSSRHFDPDDGLASIEAVYAALRLTGHDGGDLLDRYRWKAEFLDLNADALG